MSKRKKRLQKIRHDPKHVTQADLVQVLADYGFVQRAGKGSHSVFQHPGDETPIIVAVHGKHVPTYIVKQVLNAIDRVIERENIDESDSEDS